MASINVGADVTVDKLWASNKTLIVAYADYDTRVAHPFLWSNIPQVVSIYFTLMAGYNYIKTKVGGGRIQNVFRRLIFSCIRCL